MQNGEYIEQLADSTAWWQEKLAQPNVGILLGVIGNNKSGSQRPRITEILMYGALSTQMSNLPTPPASSSPQHNDMDDYTSNEHTSPRFLTVHALPLSSDLLDYSTRFSDANQSEPQFLPPFDASFDPSHGLSLPSPKRKCLSTLFDDAAERHQRAHRGGGESISAAMAITNRSISRLPPKRLGTELDGRQFQAESQPNVRPWLTRNGHSRSSSLNSIVSGRCTDESRLPKTSIENSERKMSSLSRSASVATHSKETSPTETKNKDTLSKIIMAGMRIYGFEPRKRSSRSVSQLVQEIDKERDEEYKLLYHQTLKSSVFALRSHMSQSIINVNVLREVVDKLLAVFCNDPLATIASESSFGQKIENEESAFPLSSGASLKLRVDWDADQSLFRTPQVRKRFKDAMAEDLSLKHATP
jgi:hypothetical protein